LERKQYIENYIKNGNGAAFWQRKAAPSTEPNFQGLLFRPNEAASINIFWAGQQEFQVRNSEKEKTVGLRRR